MITRQYGLPSMCLTFLAAAPLCGMACARETGEYPRLVARNGGKLEPSGLVWDPVLQVAVGVSDTGPENPGYEVFMFRPDEVDADNEIAAHRLLTRRQSEQFQLEDLEGLARTDEGEYFAMTSLSLPKDGQPKDPLARVQAVRFRLEPGPDRPSLVDLRRVSAQHSPDLRSWLLSNSNRTWSNAERIRRAEDGGIDVEGLACAPTAEDGAAVLVLGFRGPLDSAAPSGRAAPVLFLRLIEKESTEVPEASAWKSIDVGALSGSRGHLPGGIRSMDRIPGSERYIVVLESQGGSPDRQRLVLWDPQGERIQDRGDLPDNFRAEGVAVVSAKGDTLQVLLVDDKKCSVFHLTVDAWKTTGD